MERARAMKTSLRCIGLLLLFALVGVLPASAELTVETIEASHPVLPDEDPEERRYEFPLVAGDSLAASQINTYLHSVELEKLPGRHRDAPFEEVWPEREPPYDGVTGTGFRVEANQPGFLSVLFYYSYLAAYPSTGARTYNFDSRTGAPIALHRILTPDGLAQLRKRIARARLQRIDEFLAGKEMADGAKLRSDPEAAADQKKLYGDCREFIAEDDLLGDDLKLGGDRLTLSYGSCGGRWALPIDELAPFEIATSYDDLKDGLNGYGRCLLVEKRTDCDSSPSGVEAGVYRGKIGGKYRVTLVVARSDPHGQIDAAYFYDEHATQIDLSSARQDDGIVVLEEPGKPPARFELRWAEGALKGHWTQEGKKPLEAELR